MERTEPVVAVSAYGPSGASTRVRIRDWFDKAGIEAEVHSYVGGADNQLRTLSRVPWRVISAEWGLRRLTGRLRARTLILGRQASPFTSGGIEESMLRAAGHSVYDFDDALFDDTQRLTRKLWSKKRLWTRAVQAADVVIAGSNLLADAATGLSGNVVMIPSCIEPSHYIPKSDYELGEIPRAVWIGSPTTEKYLAMLEAPLLELHRRWGLRLIVISGATAGLGGLDSMVDRVPWTLDSFAGELGRADFGLMPLPDTPYARGKCAYKILQYAATALPIVASPVGANTEVIEQLGALPATTHSEWVDAVSDLIESSAQRRRQLGVFGLTAVTAGYSFDAWESRWLHAMGDPPRRPAAGQ